METATYLTELERNLMIGTGRWVADFTESFRDFPLRGVTFDLYVQGNTRAKGVLLSRVVSYLLTPNYYVGCFAHGGPFKPATLQALAGVILDYLAEQEMTWAWLVLASGEPPPARLRKQVERWDRRELGIALVDLSRPEVTARSETHIGRALARHAKTFR